MTNLALLTTTIADYAYVHSLFLGITDVLHLYL